MTLVAALQLAGCPQLADDPFDKVDEDETTHSGVGGRSTSNNATSTTGLILNGAGGSSSSGGSGTGSGGGSTTDATTTGNAGAGAPGTGGDGGNGTDGPMTSTTGSGGATEVPTTLVYAAGNSIYAAAWEGARLGTPTEWDTSPYPIAFVEARMAPDQSWALVGLQSGGEGTCDLRLYRHLGAATALVMTLEVGEPDNCSSARAFDIAFEQESGRALLVYALPEGELAYHVIEAGVPSDAEILVPTDANIAINWVRAVPDSASNRIVVGFTAEGSTRNPLFVQEWDGSSFDASHELVRNGSILYGESFDFAYFEGELIALRGDAAKDGFGYNLRGSNGDWRAEVFRPDTPRGNAQVIELRNVPTGVAGALFDATGEAASFGTLFWQDRSFKKETQLDNSLPDVENFEPASQKTDIQRLGNAAVTVYVDAYESEEDAASSLGWAVLLGPNEEWKKQHGTLPIPFDQESRNAVTRSLRLARFATDREGLVLAFAEDAGLYVSSLTDLEAGFTPPVLVDANVDGLSTTPFAWIGP